MLLRQQDSIQHPRTEPSTIHETGRMPYLGRYYHLFIVNEAEDTPLACELNLRRWNVLRGAMVVVSQVSTGCVAVCGAALKCLQCAAEPQQAGCKAWYGRRRSTMLEGKRRAWTAEAI